MGVKEGGKCVGRERERESLKFDSRTGLSTILVVLRVGVELGIIIFSSDFRNCNYIPHPLNKPFKVVLGGVS